MSLIAPTGAAYYGEKDSFYGWCILTDDERIAHRKMLLSWLSDENFAKQLWELIMQTCDRIQSARKFPKIERIDQSRAKASTYWDVNGATYYVWEKFVRGDRRSRSVADRILEGLLDEITYKEKLVDGKKTVIVERTVVISTPEMLLGHLELMLKAKIGSGSKGNRRSFVELKMMNFVAKEIRAEKRGNQNAQNLPILVEVESDGDIEWVVRNDDALTVDGQQEEGVFTEQLHKKLENFLTLAVEKISGFSECGNLIREYYFTHEAETTWRDFCIQRQIPQNKLRDCMARLKRFLNRGLDGYATQTEAKHGW